ncbi:GAF domain-containing protein [Acetobacterium malicum]|uniref:GAF domain-containing protein n=1 Tax=Acetobacterium malicum TaxID=52692 RepID=A0ABR6YTE3_9FIRM|nr:GAF domain-containing protein [Acetobacterium malicum]MBC3898443.1 GAF domain-containing protein [Acetobacterium malicum]
MSLKMSNLLDIEKYLLLELVYFHLPPQYKNRITRETPMKLDEYIDLVEQCGYSIYPGFISHSEHGYQYKKRRQAHFKRIYASSDNLGDVVITGYVNDNYGSYGNTADKNKTSFVGIALADRENNGAVIFSGCEQMNPTSIVLDWGGCLIASLGVVTVHHHKAIAFYDHYMTGILGERNILGHSKGGNLATYVYINRLDENTNAYCVNAQPYCWYTMDETQKEALKTDRFEYIVHANDPTRKASYVSYISRTAPLNRYATRRFIDIHGFAEVNFDEFGNLEGARVIRETVSQLKSRFFNDYAAEKRLTHDECMARFQEKLNEITSLPRLFSTTLDEILLVTEARAAIIWFKDEDDRGPFIYPLIIKSPGAEDLYQLKLRPGQGIAAQSVFEGLPLYIQDSRQYRLPVGSLKQAMGLTITSEIAVPLGIDEAEVFGALELVNKRGGVFSLEDFALVNDMTLTMLELFKKSGQSLDNYRDFSLLQIRKGGQRTFAVEKNGFTEKAFASPAEKNAFLKKISGLSLEPNERLIFNRITFTRDKQEQLKRLRKQEYAIIFENPHLRHAKTRVSTVLIALLLQLRENRVNLNTVAKMMGLHDKLKTRINDLTDAEYIRLEYGMARIRRSKLVIVNSLPQGLNLAVYRVLCNRLKKDCQKKAVTVIVLN